MNNISTFYKHTMLYNRLLSLEIQSSKELFCNLEKKINIDLMKKIIEYIGILEMVKAEQNKFVTHFIDTIETMKDERNKAVLYKKYIIGMSTDSIADAMDLSKSVVKKIHQKAIKELQSKLSNSNFFEACSSQRMYRSPIVAKLDIFKVNFDNVPQNELHDKLFKYIDAKQNVILSSIILNHEEKLFLLLRFAFGKTLEEIAEYMEYTSKHIQGEIQKRALDFLNYNFR